MKLPTLLFALFAAQLAAPLSHAIVIRHDVDEAAYRSLGEEHPEVVSILPDGTGVLIAPDWVLTAAHVARGVAGQSPKVETRGKEYPVAKIYIHPRWSDMGAHDIALMKLGKAVKKVTPAIPYAAGDEVGKVVTFVGRGDFGTGKTGPTSMDRVKRGATNRVDEVDEDWIFFDFDSGSSATELEGVSGPGDSGGPALVEIEGKIHTLGVSVFADGDQGPGHYGVREGYTRVSTHRSWIEEVLSGKHESGAIVVGKTATGGSGSERQVVAPATLAGGREDLPDDPAGRVVAAYLEAYNSNDDAVMTEFIAVHYTEELRTRRSEEEQRGLYRHLYDGLFGRLDFPRVQELAKDRIVVMLDAEQGGMAKFEFQLQPGDPPKIASISIAKVDVDMR